MLNEPRQMINEIFKMTYEKIRLAIKWQKILKKNLTKFEAKEYNS